MANKLQVSIIDAEKSIFAGEALYIVVAGSEGELGIFPHHAPLINQLRNGLIRVRLDSEELVFASTGGFLEVSNNQATVLVDIVERTDKLDQERLLAQKALVEQKLATAATAIYDKDIYLQLEIIIAQLSAIKYLRK
jgi:F-type H+-transporting ATPase subunit epsilon